MNIHIKLFGQLAELVGKSELALQDIPDTDSLRKKLLSDYSVLADYPFAITISKKIARDKQQFQDGDIIALLPPFAGG